MSFITINEYFKMIDSMKSPIQAMVEINNAESEIKRLKRKKQKEIDNEIMKLSKQVNKSMTEKNMKLLQ